MTVNMIGDKIVCISHNIKSISYGKIYDIINISINIVVVIDDNKNISTYNINVFKPLSEIREDLINQII